MIQIYWPQNDRPCKLKVRVAMYMADHETTSNYFWSSVACKDQSFHDYFIHTMFLGLKLRSVAQNEWKKHPYIFFFYFWSKNKQV